MEAKSLIMGFMIFTAILFIAGLTAVHFYRYWRSYRADVVIWINRRARAWLLKHDIQYQMNYVGGEIVRQREAARGRNATEDEIDKIDHHSVASRLGLKRRL